MSLTTTPEYVRCAMPFGANDHCDFAAMHATIHHLIGNDSNLLIVFYVQIMPDDFVMQLHRF